MQVGLLDPLQQLDIAEDKLKYLVTEFIEEAQTGGLEDYLMWQE
jgi:hypothetical protein